MLLKIMCINIFYNYRETVLSRITQCQIRVIVKFIVCTSYKNLFSSWNTSLSFQIHRILFSFWNIPNWFIFLANGLCLYAVSFTIYCFLSVSSLLTCVIVLQTNCILGVASFRSIGNYVCNNTYTVFVLDVSIFCSRYRRTCETCHKLLKPL